MKVWHVPFHVIEEEWTDSQYIAMVERLTERVEREQKEMDRSKSKGSGSRPGSPSSQKSSVKTSSFLGVAGLKNGD